GSLRRHPRRLGPVHVIDTDRLVRLERALQVELLGDLAYRRQHLLAQQADAGLGVLMRHVAVIAPEAEDPGPRLLEDDAPFGDDLLRRAGDDHQLFHLLFQGWPAARVRRTARRKLDKGAPIDRAAIPQWCAPPPV